MSLENESPAPGRTVSAGSMAVEVFVVLIATVGLWLGSILILGVKERAAAAFTDEHLIQLLVQECVLAVVFIPWLRSRGWRMHEVAGSPEPRDVLRGIGLWLFVYFSVTLAWTLWLSSHPGAPTPSTERDFPGVPATVALATLVAIVNPLFEEFLWLAYGVARIAPWIGMRRAAAISVALRTMVHVYQGPWAVIAILPMGLVFTWYYIRTRRLWPVVVAHVLLDAMGLASRLSHR